MAMWQLLQDGHLIRELVIGGPNDNKLDLVVTDDKMLSSYSA